ncbi:MAG: PDZ domain-containing protein [Thiolinea sp.]
MMVTKVCANTSAEAVLKEGDIITHVDGLKIENNGTLLFQPGKYINFEHQVDQHQLGDELELAIIREGEHRTSSSSSTRRQKPFMFMTRSRAILSSVALCSPLDGFHYLREPQGIRQG